ncbi:MAG TPA: hypothetical protein VN969_36505 [Streptosporangiaceae bacterium]|jgi:hypothetical protein|nr:hypothetical protein [Streptosporangiaceae bacterium]
MEEITRFGQQTYKHDDATASFRCAACGEMAAVVKAVSAGIAADMGPPLGLQAHKSDGVVVDYFGGTAWIAARPDTFTAVRGILGGDAPDPAELRQVNVDLAPFYCPDCSKNYCHADWRTYILADKSRYDSTRSTCPGGHPHAAGH